MARPYRQVPPPLEGNDRAIIFAGMASWTVALIVVAVLWDRIPASSHWWIWTCAVGVGQSLFALAYVPHLKRSRARAAQRRAAARSQPE